MQIKTFSVGQLGTNCYIVTDETTLTCAVIDPGAESGLLLNYIDDNHLTVGAIFITHGHYDHTGAVPSMYEATKATVYIHALDVSPDGVDDDLRYRGGDELCFYKEGDLVKVGNLEFHVMETPGHSRGSVTLRCEDALFTGDTLFRGSCGRTDFPGGSYPAIMDSLRRLASLEGDYEVYPGHMDATSLDRERKFNLYVRDAMEDRD